MTKQKIEKIDWFGNVIEAPNLEERKAAEAEAVAVKEAVEGFILKNANNLQLVYISEEGEISATIQELVVAVETARTSELQKFLEKNYIPFEDGTIIVSVK